jgi:ABC-type antimicrobial peptide transport system permease subunit
VVLTFNNINGDITAGAFRIIGIVKSSSLNISQLYAYVKQDDLNNLLEIGDEIHEIAIVTMPHVIDSTIVNHYNATYDGDLAEGWRQISPELAFMDEMYGSMLYVLMAIIMTALIFGIVNTMLMAVLERTRELGVLMAVGMNRGKIYMMIMLETIYLALVGAPIGLLVGWLSIKYYQHVGVDLTNYSEGLEAFGYSSILYPYLDSNTYLIVTIGVIVTAIIGAMYPAWKATRLNPVEAIHTI